MAMRIHIRLVHLLNHLATSPARVLVLERSGRGRGEGPAHLVRHTEVLDRVPPDVDLRQLEELIPVLRPPRQLSPAPREKET